MTHTVKELPTEVVYEICHNVERQAQPEGDAQFNKRRTGDCFLCSSYAIIRHFCRLADKPYPTMAEVHSVWASNHVKGGDGSTHFSNVDFWNCLNGELGDKLPFPFEMVQDPPFDVATWYMTDCFGPKVFNAASFRRRLAVYLEAGFVAHAQMQSETTSSFIKRDATPTGSDHLIVIDGVRETITYKATCYDDPTMETSWSGAIKYEIHVVDSSRKKPEPYWVDAEYFVREHGGYQMYFVRPSRRKERNWPECIKCEEHGK
jgi:hypothetical protein